MLENLIRLVRDNVQDSVVNNNEIPNEKNDEVIHAASSSIFDTLKDKMSSGNVSEIANLFNGGNADGSAVAQQAAGSFTDKLAGMGINMVTAKSLAASVIPMIMAKLSKKTADPSDSSFNIKDILGSLTGGTSGGIDLGSVMGMFNGGGNDENKQQSGDMMDKLKGMF
ncbi:hypothetical protein ABIB40_001284 [Pedobacter sp. UYP30]|uniref:hypothetical protein n=1 Tax=Pedobacter sp. UYP30 TaxID=1756400 RepID=UPI0033989A48